MALGVPLRQQRHDRLSKRIRYYLSRIWGVRLQKSQKLYFLRAGAYRAKRLVLRDSFLAEQIETRLRAVARLAYFPRPLVRFENEVWVEYVDGERPDPSDANFAKQLGEFYAALYGESPRRVPLADTAVASRLETDLDFLRGVEVIDGPLFDRLAIRARALEPSHVWLGWDYTDPVLKNFVLSREDGRLVAVDVESIEPNVLLGTGIAKAAIRWHGDPRDGELLSRATAALPELAELYDYVELCFEAHYAVRMVIERKWHHVEVPRLKALVAEDA